MKLLYCPDCGNYLEGDCGDLIAPAVGASLLTSLSATVPRLSLIGRLRPATPLLTLWKRTTGLSPM